VTILAQAFGQQVEPLRGMLSPSLKGRCPLCARTGPSPPLAVLGGRGGVPSLPPLRSRAGRVIPSPRPVPAHSPLLSARARSRWRAHRLRLDLDKGNRTMTIQTVKFSQLRLSPSTCAA
jgi:hypothetical protein